MVDQQAIEHLFNALNVYSLPVGIYVVRTQETGEEAITHCNAEFAQLLGYDSIDDLLGVVPANLHRSHQEYAKFMSDLRSETRVLHYIETLKTKNDSFIMVEVHAQLDFDAHGQVIGRSGIVLEVSEFEQLLKDIGQVLHHFTSTMTGFEKRLRALHEHLTPTPDPFGDIIKLPASEVVDLILEKPAANLLNALVKMLTEVGEDERKISVLKPYEWETIQEKTYFFEIYKVHVEQPELRPFALRGAARDVINIVRRIKRGYLSNESLRHVIDNALEIERLVSLLDLHLTLGRLIEFDHEVLTLRELALDKIRHKEPLTEISVASLMTTSQRYMQDFAASRDIELKVYDTTKKQALVNVRKRDIERALQNLIHNAIKYSWSKRNERPYVEIRGSVQQDYAVIEVENYGVPIPRREIETGLIFNMGSRGSTSSDRARLGTGIGLYDSQQVARDHHGEVSITSRPARHNGDIDDLEQPFVTIVTLRIPVSVRGV